MAKKKKLSPNYMDLVFTPAEKLHWEQRKDGMVILDMVNKGFFHKIAQLFFHKPRVSHIALDKYGTKLWLALDGKRTVYDVIAEMQKAFPAEKERMTDRVITFLCTLQTNHFICEKNHSINA